MPPLMPAAKLRPVGPSTTTRPPVMYSQPWSPTPSTTAYGAAVAHAEAFAGPAADEGPAGGGAIQGHVADDDVLFGRKVAPSGGRMASMAPERPLPK
jgi:hypothetical protein